MDVENKIIEKLANTNVLDKAYDDLVHPTAEPIGQMVSFVPRTMRVWLQRWEKWIINAEESVGRTLSAVGDRANSIPEEHLVEPAAHLAVPAIQQLAYCYDSEDLREMYARLLLSSMDDRTSEYVHPSFVQILKEISPDEAKLLSALVVASNEHMSIPMLDLRIVPQDQIVPYKWRTLLEGYNECCIGVCEYPDQSLIYLNNLERLGILERRNHYTENDIDKLEAFETSETIRSAKEKASLGKDDRFDFQRWSYQPTDFGTNFIKVCVRDNL